MPVGTGRILTLRAGRRALGPGDLYWAGRATLVSRREDIAAFDRAFEEAFGIVGRPSPRQQVADRRPASSRPASCR